MSGPEEWGGRFLCVAEEQMSGSSDARPFRQRTVNVLG